MSELLQVRNMDRCTYPEVDRSVPKSAARRLSERYRTEQFGTELGCGRHRLQTVDAARLRHCYRYLSHNLSLPCVAWYPEPTDENGGCPCTVMELIDPATGPGNKFDGIFCKVRIGKQERNLALTALELPPEDPNYRLVQRCLDCFWHWR